MRTVRTIAAVREHVAAARAGGRSIGLVPTMGAYHAGHEALMRAARERCDEVVVSLFVNPAQFEDAGDLTAYPRSEAEDAAIAAELGVDLLFAPPVAEIYPDGFAPRSASPAWPTCSRGPSAAPPTSTASARSSASCSTSSRPTSRSSARRTPSRSSCCAVIVRDLDIPVRLEVVATVREPDGLALSSRNARLDPSERERALALSRALAAVRDAIEGGERDAAAAEAAGRAAMDGTAPDYLAVVDPETLERVARDRRPGTSCGRGPRRARTSDRQHPHRTGGDPRSGRQPKELIDVLPAKHRPPPDHAHEAGRDARARRADRHGHRLRPPEREGRRGGRRRHRAGRRQRRQHRARLRRHRAGDGRGDADPHRGSAARARHAAARRRPAVRLLRGVRRAGDRDRPPLRQGGRLRRRQARGLGRSAPARSSRPACR